MLYMATGELAHSLTHSLTHSPKVRLSPETCRVKPLRLKNAIVASCWTYFTTISKLVSRYDKCLSVQGDYVE